VAGGGGPVSPWGTHHDRMNRREGIGPSFTRSSWRRGGRILNSHARCGAFRCRSSVPTRKTARPHPEKCGHAFRETMFESIDRAFRDAVQLASRSRRQIMSQSDSPESNTNDAGHGCALPFLPRKSGHGTKFQSEGPWHSIRPDFVRASRDGLSRGLNFPCKGLTIHHANRMRRRAKIVPDKDEASGTLFLAELGDPATAPLRSGGEAHDEV